MILKLKECKTIMVRVTTVGERSKFDVVNVIWSFSRLFRVRDAANGSFGKSTRGLHSICHTYR